MATTTLGTTATTSLTSLAYLRGWNSGMAAADVATINNLIKDPINPAHPLAGASYFTSEGVLYLPRARGMIKMEPGDYIGVDSQGWPIVVCANSIANAAWTHS